MKKLAILAAAVILMSSVAAAQGVKAYGGSIDGRASTRILFWEGTQQAAGEVAVNYGRPEWKAEYKDKLDQMTNGKYWRLGNNFWTVLDTNLPIKIGGVDVPVGFYYLAVHRSQDGSKWQLAFLSADKARSHRLDAFEVATRMPNDLEIFAAPLEFSENTETAKELTILLTNDPQDVKKASLKISWGNFQLTAPVVIEVG